MLVLSRKVHEIIVIETPQGPIEVSVVRITPDKIRLGIDAPKSINVYRKELHGNLKEHPPEDGQDISAS